MDGKERLSAMIASIKGNEGARIGTVMRCPTCSKRMMKKTHNQIYCGRTCKEDAQRFRSKATHVPTFENVEAKTLEQQIVIYTCRKYDVHPNVFLKIAPPRVAFYEPVARAFDEISWVLCRRMGLRYREIGKIVNRDPSAVGYAFRRHQARIGKQRRWAA